MYIATSTETEKPSIIESVITGNVEILKSILVNTKEQVKMSKICLELLKSDVELRAANLENTINAQAITKIVDESILFRSLANGDEPDYDEPDDSITLEIGAGLALGLSLGGGK